MDLEEVCETEGWITDAELQPHMRQSYELKPHVSHLSDLKPKVNIDSLITVADCGKVLIYIFVGTDLCK
jgi:hypothetical protein